MNAARLTGRLLPGFLAHFFCVVFMTGSSRAPANLRKLTIRNGELICWT